MLRYKTGMRRSWSEVARGFSAFVVAARLLWHVHGLRRVAAASAALTALWIATLLLVLEGLEGGRLVALGPAVSRGLSNTLLVASVFVLLFAFPSLGPISLALQQRAAEHARAFLQGLEAAPRAVSWWAEASLYHLLGMYRRVFVLGGLLVLVAATSEALVPDSLPAVERALQVLLFLAVFALDALSRSLAETPLRERSALLGRRYPELIGYIAGAWCLTLFGLGPWFVILDTVGAEVFRARLRDPGLTVDWNLVRQRATSSPVDQPRIPIEVAQRLRQRYLKTYSKLKWGARLPSDARLMFVGLVGERPGEDQIGALLLTDETGNARLHEGAEFWFVATRTPPTGAHYSSRIGDDYAGPFAL